MKDQIVATRTDVLEEQECDFSAAGERLLQEILENLGRSMPRLVLYLQCVCVCPVPTIVDTRENRR